MPLHIVRNDITQMKVDAIVNAANETLLGGGGVDGAIHRAAGPGLLAECRTLNGCRTGEAKVTGAYRLPCRYVIHTVGPIWRGGLFGERQKLISCYRTSLSAAEAHRCETVAFPLISSGVYGYPKDKALRVAVDTISDFLSDHEMTVYLVIFDKASFQIGERLFRSIESYIDDHYAAAHEDSREVQRSRILQAEQSYSFKPTEEDAAAPFPKEKPSKISDTPKAAPAAKPFPGSRTVAGGAALFPEPASALAPHFGAAASLEEALRRIDESFSEMLLRKIDERGMTDAQCYKKANIDRKLFSKIRNDRLYRPSKPTVLAFAIALELPLEETKDMLMKAGFALSHSSRFDIIVEYFISKGNYNIFEINEALFAFDQNLLGA